MTGDVRMDIRNLLKPKIEKMKANKDIDGLIDAVRYRRDWKTRMRAVDILGEIGDKRAVEPLIEALEDENKHVRLASVVALGKIGDRRAVESLIEALRSKELREVAAFTLGEIRDGKAVQQLLQILNDENEYVREAAPWALGKIGRPAVDSLIQALENEDCYVREGAVSALGHFSS